MPKTLATRRLSAVPSHSLGRASMMTSGRVFVLGIWMRSTRGGMASATEFQGNSSSQRGRAELIEYGRQGHERTKNGYRLTHRENHHGIIGIGVWTTLLHGLLGILSLRDLFHRGYCRSKNDRFGSGCS